VHCRHGPSNHLALLRSTRNAFEIDEELISRGEVAALLFNVSDIAVSLTHIERLLEGDDDEEESDEG
jgi:hypothetical protein